MGITRFGILGPKSRSVNICSRRSNCGLLDLFCTSLVMTCDDTIQELVEKSFINKFWSRELTFLIYSVRNLRPWAGQKLVGCPNPDLCFKTLLSRDPGLAKFRKQKLRNSRLWADPGYFLTNS